MSESLPWLLFFAFALGAACSAVAIPVAQHGKIIVSQGYGMAGVKAGIPNSPNTQFRIASVTREFTAMVILELQARQTEHSGSGVSRRQA